jgi:hypothetical protein
MVDVITDPAERQAQGLPEKISISEEVLGTAEAFTVVCTQNSPAVVKKLTEANTAVRAADTAETKATVKGKEAGKALLRLRAIVKAESPDVAWSVWCADFLGHFGIRTIERYIALVEPKPEPVPPEPTEDAVTTEPKRNADATNAVRQKRHRDKLNVLRGKPLKGKEVSAKTEITKLVKGLSERRASELLGQIKEWIGEDE